MDSSKQAASIDHVTSREHSMVTLNPPVGRNYRPFALLALGFLVVAGALFVLAAKIRDPLLVARARRPEPSTARHADGSTSTRVVIRKERGHILIDVGHHRLVIACGLWTDFFDYGYINDTDILWSSDSWRNDLRVSPQEKIPPSFSHGIIEGLTLGHPEMRLTINLLPATPRQTASGLKVESVKGQRKTHLIDLAATFVAAEGFRLRMNIDHRALRVANGNAPNVPSMSMIGAVWPNGVGVSLPLYGEPPRLLLFSADGILLDNMPLEAARKTKNTRK